MRTIILLMCILFLSSCEKVKTTRMCCDRGPNVGLILQVLSKNGEDYLNPENPNHLKFEKIRLFYLYENKKIEYYEPLSDLPRKVGLNSPSDFGLNDDSPYSLTLDSVIPENNKMVTMYLQWNKGMEDEIQCEFEKSESGGFFIRVTKVWINSKLVWDEKSDGRTNPYRTLTIIK